MADRQTAAGLPRDRATAPFSADDHPSFPSIRQKLDGGFGAIRMAGEGLNRAERALLDLRFELGVALVLDRSASPEVLADGHVRLRDAAVSGDSDGTNLLVIAEGDDLTFSVGSALMRNGDGAITLRPVEVDRTRTALFDAARPAGERRGLLDRVTTVSGSALAEWDAARLCGRDPDYLAEVLRQVEAALTGLKSAFSHLSIARSRLDLQASFIASLCSASPDRPLPDALELLEGDALRRTALETKRLLSEQGQSIASLNRETILRLFQKV